MNERRWHRTKEETPFDTLRYLVCDGDGLMTLAYYSRGFWIFYDGKSVPANDFEWWHPLPPRPSSKHQWASAQLECPKCGWEGQVVWPTNLLELDCEHCGEKSPISREDQLRLTT